MRVARILAFYINLLLFRFQVHSGFFVSSNRHFTRNGVGREKGVIDIWNLLKIETTGAGVLVWIEGDIPIHLISRRGDRMRIGAVVKTVETVPAKEENMNGGQSMQSEVFD